ncbi:hypothetical protein QJS04_geneDACA011585 [Acorus gramineus]|uniref:Uncharacterized protein n=1 Tax=Acorus gramineus TaxID=55184 RepID=A0AAV9AC71_ACOGR|nr:hypothetical protein QJS04_geneDACA011585 [Acorus gramineus]
MFLKVWQISPINEQEFLCYPSSIVNILSCDSRFFACLHLDLSPSRGKNVESLRSLIEWKIKL